VPLDEKLEPADVQVTLSVKGGSVMGGAPVQGDVVEVTVVFSTAAVELKVKSVAPSGMKQALPQTPPLTSQTENLTSTSCIDVEGAPSGSATLVVTPTLTLICGPPLQHGEKFAKTFVFW
jgi:hypothetical protein